MFCTCSRPLLARCRPASTLRHVRSWRKLPCDRLTKGRVLTPTRVRQESWQRIGGASPPRGRSSQPPRPRVMHEVLLARAAVKRSQGRPWAGYRAAKRVQFRGADLVLVREGNTTHAQWLAWVDLAQSETLRTWRRSLHGTWETSSVSGVEYRTGSCRQQPNDEHVRG